MKGRANPDRLLAAQLRANLTNQGAPIEEPIHGGEARLFVRKP